MIMQITHDERESIIKDVLQKCEEIRQTKSIGYAGNKEDVNFNFRVTSQRWQVPIEKVIMIHLDKHFEALRHFINNDCQHLGGENVGPKVIDEINYLLILYSEFKKRGLITE